MSTNNQEFNDNAIKGSNDESKVKKVAQNIDNEDIDKNLNTANEDNSKNPQDLSEEEQTPFIDDSVRTDKR